MTDTREAARFSRRSFLRKGALGGSAAAATALARGGSNHPWQDRHYGVCLHAPRKDAQST
jgi:hypothetical protein